MSFNRDESWTDARAPGSGQLELLSNSCMHVNFSGGDVWESLNHSDEKKAC